MSHLEYYAHAIIADRHREAALARQRNLARRARRAAAGRPRLRLRLRSRIRFA